MEPLKRRTDFKAVYERGRYAANPWLVMHMRPNGLRCNRLGISVSRKVGKAVVRNRLKRRIREWFREGVRTTALRNIENDIVVVVRPPAATEACDLQAALTQLCTKRGLLS